MTPNSQISIERSNTCQLLYNPDLLTTPTAGFLTAEIFQQADTYQQISAGGRGQAWVIEMGKLSAVLRTYLRGGLIARINQQSYFGLNAENSRSFKEWRLLQWMHDLGLPVPRPIAASVCRWPFSFSPFYRAHILVELIPHAQTLDQLLSQQSLNNIVWHSIGQSIRRFHNAGVYHADLNASNIMLNKEQSVYLIDFDKGEIRGNQQWKQANLQRLKRSLIKQQGIHQKYHFSEQNWSELLSGYESG